METKIVVIGAGPAGWTAAIYAARAGLKPLVVAGPTPGGQLTITTDVENFPGFPDAVTGPELMTRMQEQAERFGSVVLYDTVTSLEIEDGQKIVRLESGQELIAGAVIIATGAKARWLGVPGETEFMGRGVSGCATCDGFFFRGQEVAVVGGGNVAVEEAIHLAGLASRVTLIHRRDQLRCEAILADRLAGLPNVAFLWDNVVTEIKGDEGGVDGILVQNTKTSEAARLDVTGVFVAIGHDPATDFISDSVKRFPSGHVWVRPGSVETSVPGVFAAGDVMDPAYRQAVTSAGFGCMAALAAQHYLQSIR